MVRLGSTVRFRLEAPKIYKGVTMEKFFNALKMKIEDETAAFAILGAMIVTFAITIGAFDYIRYTKLAEVSANTSVSQGAEKAENFSKGETSQTDTSNVITNEIQEEKAIDEDEAKKKNEEEYEKLKKENKISSAADKYYIKVNYGAQVVTVYSKNSSGKYTPIKAMVCSTGRATPTSGTYRTLGKGNWWPLMGNVYGQYSTWICGDILFHSVPYLESGNKSSLEWWAYDQLGQRVSAGCIRLTVADAKWIYTNCPVGTQVEFYSSSNPGPLGKPTTRKISDAPNYVKGWDPTDPDSKNPWPKYLKDLEKQKEEDKKKEEENKNEINTNTSGSTNTTVDTNTTDTNTTNTNTTDTNTTNTVDEPNTNTTGNTNTTDNTNTLENNTIGNGNTTTEGTNTTNSTNATGGTNSSNKV